MADIPLSDISGVKEYIVESSYPIAQISGGQPAGTILTISCPTGKKIRLDSLFCTFTNTEVNISFSFGVRNIISGTLDGNNNDPIAGRFKVSNAYGSIQAVIGKVGEDFVLSKSGGATVQSIYYSYSILGEA